MTDHPFVAKAFQYVEDVLTGKELACRWVRLACERHRRDLGASEAGTFRWVFDPVKAERPCKVVELLPHTKGKWAANRQRIKLENWQCFIICSVFGWVDRETGLRRFREVFTLVPRKNGKSALSAAVGIYMLAYDNEMGAEVYCNATSEKQALEVFTPAKVMVSNSPNLISAKGIKVNASNLNVADTHSKFEPVIGKPGDGSSPSFAIIDEYHEHAASDAHDTMLTGMGAREQPILWVITTAGDNLAGPCYNRQITVQDILAGAIDDDRSFGIIYTVDPDDDWTDPASLRKANPNMGVSVGEEYLLDMQKRAITNPRDQGSFKTKHLNIWVNSRQAYFNSESWAKCPKAPPLEDMRGRRCWLALDLASKVDLTALEMLFPLGDGHYARYGKIYLPEDTVDDPKNTHYHQWREQGLIEVTGGNIVDYSYIEEDILELARRYEIADCSYDPFQATYVSTRLAAQGINMVEYRQTVQTMSDPMKTLDSWILAGKLHHNCGVSDPMTWQIANVVSRTDRKDNVFPNKEQESKKIDSPVALIMCVGRATLDTGPERSAYEDRGLLII